jgi:hypothetical protein
MTLTCTYNCNINYQELTSLFLPFGSTSNLTFVAILSRSCCSLAVASFGILYFENLRRKEDTHCEAFL